MPALEQLNFGGENTIGDQGLIALATPLRKHLALTDLWLYGNQIGDEGVAALVTPGEGVLPKLELLQLEYNKITDRGCAALVTALESGVMPKLKQLDLLDPRYCAGPNPASEAAVAAVYAARPALTDSYGVFPRE